MVMTAPITVRTAVRPSDVARRRGGVFMKRDLTARMPVFAPGTSILTPMPLTVHRFEQTIGSQHYVVEVRPALRDRWRACLVRTAGVPTALMPFYGATPRDALDALVSWLSHAHGVAAGSL